jgi:hypothetical protein
MKALIIFVIFIWGGIVSSKQTNPFFLQLTEKWKSLHLEYTEKYIKFQDMQLSKPAFAWSWDSFYKFYYNDTNVYTKYQKRNNLLTAYLNGVITPDHTILRIINKQNYRGINLNEYEEHMKQTPDIIYIYGNDDIYRLTYCNEDLKIIDTFINLKSIDFDFLLDENNFEEFESELEWNTLLWIYSGVGVSISVYTPEIIFTAGAYRFWNYKDDKILGFNKTYGDQKTRQELIKLMSYLFEFGVFKDGRKAHYYIDDWLKQVKIEE